jgi:hypothetical protein
LIMFLMSLYSASCINANSLPNVDMFLMCIIIHIYKLILFQFLWNNKVNWLSKEFFIL